MDFTKKEVGESLLENGHAKIVIVKQATGNTTYRPLLSIVDILLSIFVVCPLGVCCWRGLWGLMDIHKQFFPGLHCFLVGMIVHILFAVCQDSLHNVIIEAEKHWTLRIISHFLRRFYTYIFFGITILHWRGCWALFDYYTNIQFTENNVVKKEGSQYALIIGSICFAILASIRGLRNATAPPFALCLDKGSYVFRFPTMFKQKGKDNMWLYTLDCMFSVAILGNLVVMFWRGTWIIVDIILLPNDYVLSTWASLVLGLFQIGLVYRLQNCMKNLCSKYTGIARVVLADCYIFLSIIGTILYWRGMWNLLYIYFLPNNVELSCQLTHTFGFMFLILLGCSNSLLVRGVYKDGKEPNGNCVVFPCEYLRVVLDQENSHQSENYNQDLEEEKTLNNNKV